MEEFYYLLRSLNLNLFNFGKIIIKLTASENINNIFGGKIRVRVCGVLVEEDRYLLANHHGINGLGNFWCAPGGGVEFGETIENALKREFLEETNLQVEVGKFLDFFEFVSPPLHAIELFFEVKKVGGNLNLGYDPETGNEVLKKVKWFNMEDLSQLENIELHNFFIKF